MSRNILMVVYTLVGLLLAYFIIQFGLSYYKKQQPTMFLQPQIINQKVVSKGMKGVLLTTIRNKEASMSDFRKATESLASLLANEASSYLETETIEIETPWVKTTGTRLKNNIVLIVVLKGGLTLLNPFMKFFKNDKVKVGFIGSKREKKFSPVGVYYVDLPQISESDEIIVLESVLASGGTACNTINNIKEAGGKEGKITLVTFVSSEQGIKRIKKELPCVKIVTACNNEKLNKEHCVVPGVGRDFGARFYGW